MSAASHVADSYSFCLAAAETLSVDASGITRLDAKTLQVYNQQDVIKHNASLYLFLQVT
jgi:hypothetical protein